MERREAMERCWKKDAAEKEEEQNKLSADTVILHTVY